MKVAVISLIFDLIFGVLFAYLILKLRFSGKTVIEAVFVLPLVMPPVVTGFILLILVGKQGPVGKLLSENFQTQVLFTPYAAVLAGTVIAFPLMCQSAKAAMQNVDVKLEDAAKTLGSSEWARLPCASFLEWLGWPVRCYHLPGRWESFALQ